MATQYTFNTLPTGNVEILKDGQRISTGTAGYASQFGYTPISSNIVNPSSVSGIDSSLFKTKETTPFQTPAPTITPPITVPQLTLTEPEKQASQASKSLQDLENILAGKSAYEQEQIKAYDISGKRAVTQSLYNQIATLKAQTEAIPMELERSAGGVVTREILGRQQRELTAQNAEKALILNAQYNAAQGDLALAQQNVQDAVNAKFAPYESQKNALLANLKYIKESPEYTIAEKNRAIQKEAEINQQAAEKKQVSDIYKSVAQMAADAATKAGVDSLTLKKVQDLATSIGTETSVSEAQKIMSEAQQIIAPYMQAEAPVSENIKEFKSFFPNVDITTPAGRQQYLNWKNQMSLMGKVPEIKTINGVDMQWNPTTGKWESLGAGTAGTGGKQEVTDQLNFLRNTAKEALNLASASGPSGVGRWVGDVFVGDTKFRQLEALTNTLKTNMLTMATDPNIKKFFGPQMSNADVLLMTSAGTTLNPQSNSPAQMRNEIKRLDTLFNKLQTAAKSAKAQTEVEGTMITAPDGTQVIITD